MDENAKKTKSRVNKSECSAAAMRLCDYLNGNCIMPGLPVRFDYNTKIGLVLVDSVGVIHDTIILNRGKNSLVIKDSLEGVRKLVQMIEVLQVGDEFTMSSKSVCELLGVNQSELDEYEKQGRIASEYDNRRGRLYREDEVIGLRQEMRLALLDNVE